MSARGEAKRSALLVLGTSLLGAAEVEVATRVLVVVETAEEANNDFCMSICYKIYCEDGSIMTCNLPAEVTVLLASVLAALDSTVLDSAVEEALVEVEVMVTVDRVLEALLEATTLPT